MPFFTNTNKKMLFTCKDDIPPEEDRHFWQDFIVLECHDEHHSVATTSLLSQTGGEGEDPRKASSSLVWFAVRKEVASWSKLLADMADLEQGRAEQNRDVAVDGDEQVIIPLPLWIPSRAIVEHFLSFASHMAGLVEERFLCTKNDHGALNEDDFMGETFVGTEGDGTIQHDVSTTTRAELRLLLEEERLTAFSAFLRLAAEKQTGRRRHSRTSHRLFPDADDYQNVVGSTRTNIGTSGVRPKLISDVLTVWETSFVHHLLKPSATTTGCGKKEHGNYRAFHLVELAKLANFLNCPVLLHLCCFFMAEGLIDGVQHDTDVMRALGGGVLSQTVVDPQLQFLHELPPDILGIVALYFCKDFSSAMFFCNLGELCLHSVATCEPFWRGEDEQKHAVAGKHLQYHPLCFANRVWFSNSDAKCQNVEDSSTMQMVTVEFNLLEERMALFQSDNDDAGQSGSSTDEEGEEEDDVEGNTASISMLCNIKLDIPRLSRMLREPGGTRKKEPEQVVEFNVGLQPPSAAVKQLRDTAMRCFSRLPSLSCADSALCDSDIRSLFCEREDGATPSKALRQLKALDLSGNQLSTSTPSFLCFLPNSLQHLNLSTNPLGDAGFCTLFVSEEAYQLRRSLICLHLTGCRIDVKMSTLALQSTSKTEKQIRESPEKAEEGKPDRSVNTMTLLEIQHQRWNARHRQQQTHSFSKLRELSLAKSTIVLPGTKQHLATAVSQRARETGMVQQWLNAIFFYLHDDDDDGNVPNNAQSDSSVVATGVVEVADVSRLVNPSRLSPMFPSLRKLDLSGIVINNKFTSLSSRHLVDILGSESRLRKTLEILWIPAGVGDNLGCSLLASFECLKELRFLHTPSMSFGSGEELAFTNDCLRMLSSGSLAVSTSSAHSLQCDEQNTATRPRFKDPATTLSITELEKDKSLSCCAQHLVVLEISAPTLLTEEGVQTICRRFPNLKTLTLHNQKQMPSAVRTLMQESGMYEMASSREEGSTHSKPFFRNIEVLDFKFSNLTEDTGMSVLGQTEQMQQRAAATHRGGKVVDAEGGGINSAVLPNSAHQQRFFAAFPSLNDMRFSSSFSGVPPHQQKSIKKMLLER